jgi:chemotaxis family two-component system response regulator Rcp1
MRRILVVADQLLGGVELRERLALKKSTDPHIEVFVLVPERSPAESDVRVRSAQRILELELAVLRDLQYDVDGAVGAADPLAAVRDVLATRPFDEIILLASPPAGASRWFRMDLAHRLQRATKLPVEEIAGEEPDAAEEARLAALQFPGLPAAAAPAGDPVRVLLVEDDEDDAELTRLALERCTTPSTLQTVGDGAQAVKWLNEAGGPAGVDLVLVDLKMPVMDGFELLERLRADHDLERLAVVVLTTSGRMEDRQRAHSLGAHAYVTKDPSFPLYRDLLEGLLSDVAR